MRAAEKIKDRISSREELARQCRRWQLAGKKIVFTNGCFDILHKGHLEILSKAASLGDVLIVGVNSDQSVRHLKGNERPVNDEHFRALMLASLMMVDAVCIFPEETPEELIRELIPDILVKGGDYKPEQIAGAEFVVKNGGDVIIVPLVQGYSTSGIIAKIREL